MQTPFYGKFFKEKDNSLKKIIQDVFLWPQKRLALLPEVAKEKDSSQGTVFNIISILQI